MNKIDIKTLKNKKGKFDPTKIEALIQSKPLHEPITEQEHLDMSVKVNRDPYIEFPNRLPTIGKMPLPVDEHKLIGMFENNQTIYLTIAVAYNKAMELIEQLQQEIETLKKKNGV